MRARTLIAVAGLLALLCGCEQKPYRVFAVQLNAPPPAMHAAPMAPAEPSAAAATMKARHPQLDLNRATGLELRQLPGITSAEIAAIIAARPFKDKRELTRRKLISQEEYDRWKDYLVVHRKKTT